MPFEDVFSGGLSGGLQGLQVGMNIGNMMQQKSLAQQQAARQKKIFELGLLQRQGEIYSAVDKIMELPPAQRKPQLVIADEQLKKIQQFSGQEPVGLGQGMFEMIAKADEATAAVVRPILQQYGAETLKGNPDAWMFWKDPIRQAREIAEEARKQQLHAKNLELMDTMKGFFPGGIAGQAGQGTAGQGTVGEQPASGSSGGPMASQPPFAISQAPSAGQTQYRPSFTMGPQGASVTLSPKDPNFAFSTEDEPLADGSVQRWAVRGDPATGQRTRLGPIGVPIVPDELRKINQAAQMVGLQPGSPEHSAFTIRMQLAPPEVRAKFFEQAMAASQARGAGVMLDRNPDLREGVSVGVPRSVGQVAQQSGIGAAPTLTTARDQMRAEDIADKAETAGRVTAANEAAKPLDAQGQGAMAVYTTTLKLLDDIDRDFTPEERKAFAGLWQSKGQDFRAGINSLGQYLGLPAGEVNAKYQKFKALMAQVKQFVFGDAGKNVTNQEAAIVFGGIPTGDEMGGPTAFEEKKAEFRRRLERGRAIRLDLERKGKGKIDLKELDRLISQEFGGGGVSLGGGNNDPLGIR